MIYLQFATIVMNALIEAYENYGKIELTFDEIVRYGKKVANYLNYDKDVTYIPLFSREHQCYVIESFTEYIETDAYVNHQKFKLANIELINKMKEYFKWLHNFELQDALKCEEAIQELNT